MSDIPTRLRDEADRCRQDGADDIARLLDEAAGAFDALQEVHHLSEHLHARNASLMLLVSDLGAALSSAVSGIDHLNKLAREWEPDHSSGADRAGWVRAMDARGTAFRLMAGIPDRLTAHKAVDRSK